MQKLNLVGIGSLLSRDHMKKITGGDRPVGVTCTFSGWVAHNSAWTQISECATEDQAKLAMEQYGLSNYCHDSCHASCCAARPTTAGC